MLSLYEVDEQTENTGILMNQLLNGIPQGDLIRTAGDWKYYQIIVNPGHEKLSVRSTTFTGLLLD